MATYRPTTFFSRITNYLFIRNSRQVKPEKLIGIDYKGNQYYEIEGEHIQERKLDGVVLGKRYFFPSGENEDQWDEYVPPEWEAWLRYRRIEPPTEEEINLNLAVAYAKQLNAKKLEEQRQIEGPKAIQQIDKSLTTSGFDNETGDKDRRRFPVFEEYEISPGEGPGHHMKTKPRHNPYID